MIRPKSVKVDPADADVPSGRTLTKALTLFPLKLAATVVIPTATPVTVPVALTVAIERSVDSQTALIGEVVPSLWVPVTVRRTVLPTFTVAVERLSARLAIGVCETTDVGDGAVGELDPPPQAPWLKTTATVLTRSHPIEIDSILIP